MFKSEEKLVFILSASIFGLLLFVFSSYIEGLNILYFTTIPLYIGIISCCNKLIDSRERVEDAVSYCLDDSDFNVIDKIEQLRLYFKDTSDVVDYLSVVDLKVLSFAFDERNVNLSYKEFVIGAVRCLCALQGYSGYCYFNINSIVLNDKERVTILLSTLYMVAKLIDRNCKSIVISSKLSKGNVAIDVVDQHKNLMDDQFCDKLFNMFSSDHLTLSHSHL